MAIETGLFDHQLFKRKKGKMRRELTSWLAGSQQKRAEVFILFSSSSALLSPCLKPPRYFATHIQVVSPVSSSGNALTDTLRGVVLGFLLLCRDTMTTSTLIKDGVINWGWHTVQRLAWF